MSEKLPVVYIARHGDTAWTLTGQHTGLTDLPLTAIGEQHAQQLGQRLKGMVLAPRWLALGPGSAGRYFLLDTASLGALGYEHNLSQPVIRLWNDDHHVTK